MKKEEDIITEDIDIYDDENIIKIVKEDIETYTNDQLLSYYNQYWKNSKSSFAKIYGVNQSNFSSWTNGKRESQASVYAVRKFLTEYCNDNFSKQKSYNSNVTPSSLIERMKSMTKYTNLDIIVFVDIDNMFSYFTNNIWVEAENIHFIIVLSLKSVCINKATLIEKCNCSIVRTKSEAKNAADVLLTILITNLHSILSSNIKFIIVSNDGFIKEVEKTLVGFHPKRKIISSKPYEVNQLI